MYSFVLQIQIMEPWKEGSPKFVAMAKELDAKGLDYYIIKQMAGDTITEREKMM